jgi:hypothetical protein
MQDVPTETREPNAILPNGPFHCLFACTLDTARTFASRRDPLDRHTNSLDLGWSNARPRRLRWRTIAAPHSRSTPVRATCRLGTGEPLARAHAARSAQRRRYGRPYPISSFSHFTLGGRNIDGCSVAGGVGARCPNRHSRDPYASQVACADGVPQRRTRSPQPCVHLWLRPAARDARLAGRGPGLGSRCCERNLV